MDNKAQISFDLLPKDVFLFIICLLDIKQIFRITRVCKRFQHVISLIQHIPYEDKLLNSGINPFVKILPSLLPKLPGLVSIDHRYGPIETSRFIPIIYAKITNNGHLKELSEFLVTKPKILYIKLLVDAFRTQYSIYITNKTFRITFLNRMRNAKWISVLKRWYMLYRGEVVIDSNNGPYIKKSLLKKLIRKKIPISRVICIRSEIRNFFGDEYFFSKEIPKEYIMMLLSIGKNIQEIEIYAKFLDVLILPTKSKFCSEVAEKFSCDVKILNSKQDPIFLHRFILTHKCKNHPT